VDLKVGMLIEAEWRTGKEMTKQEKKASTLALVLDADLTPDIQAVLANMADREIADRQTQGTSDVSHGQSLASVSSAHLANGRSIQGQQRGGCQ
jgi:hypothetical protein